MTLMCVRLMNSPSIVGSFESLATSYEYVLR